MSKTPTLSFRPVQKGYLRTPGRLHLHVDSRDVSKFGAVSDYVRNHKVVGKFSTVAEWTKGSQWREDAHNAPGDGPEHFLSFAIRDRTHAVVTLREILPLIAIQEGVVVEAERVLTYVSSNSTQPRTGFQPEGEIYSPEVGYAKSPTSPVEIHHCFDLPKRAKTPFSLEQLCSDLESEGLQVRTWSLFEKSDVFSFHSSLFTFGVAIDARCKAEFEILRNYLRKRNLDFREAWVIAEEVLGIWQTPFAEAEGETYPNRVSVEDLIGAVDKQIDFPQLIDKCQNDPSEGASETDDVQIKEIVGSLSVFEEVVRSRRLEPLLIELALCDDLPNRPNGVQPDNRSFGAHVVAYADTKDSHVLRAWLQAIDRIVAPGGLQIDPIVSHSETYGCGFLFDDLQGRVESAYRDLAREGSTQDVRSRHRTMLQQTSDTVISACRRIYAFSPETTLVPVDNTVVALSKGFVTGVLESMLVAHSDNDQRAMLQVFDKLLSSYLLIVPFRWPGRFGADEDSDTADLRPGGCLFVVVAPNVGERNLDQEKLKNLAIRLGWLLFRAALHVTHTAAATSGRNKRTNWQDKKRIFNEVAIIRTALNKAKLIQSGRLECMLEQAPFLKNRESTIDVIKTELSRPFNIEPVLRRIVSTHYDVGYSTVRKWGDPADASN